MNFMQATSGWRPEGDKGMDGEPLILGRDKVFAGNPKATDPLFWPLIREQMGRQDEPSLPSGGVCGCSQPGLGRQDAVLPRGGGAGAVCSNKASLTCTPPFILGHPPASASREAGTTSILSLCVWYVNIREHTQRTESSLPSLWNRASPSIDMCVP